MPAATDALPRLRAPPGACDTHIHFMTTNIHWRRPPPWTPGCGGRRLSEAAQASRRRRTVVVQPTAYGTDNRCTLEAVAAMGKSARGVVVVDDSATDAELERLTKAGVRGIRFHMLAGGVLPWDLLERMSARVHEFGWLVQLQFDGRQFPEREKLIRARAARSSSTISGKFLEPVPVDHPSFRVLLRLLERQHPFATCWGL